MKKLINELITWDKLDNDLKGRPEFHIKKAEISKNAASFTITVRLNFVVPYENHLKIRSVVKERLNCVENVYIIYEYSDMVTSEEKTVSLFSGYISDITLIHLYIFLSKLLFSHLCS